MATNRSKPQRKPARKLANLVRKLGDEEIKMFLVVLASIMKQVPAPADARKSYLLEVESRLRNNGADFLSKSRAFPTFGLKLLGNDRDGFPIPGFKKQNGKCYPSLFAWYWSELERLSDVSKPSPADVLRAQRVLCVLSFAKMIKTSSVNQIRKALIDFEARVDPHADLSDEQRNELLDECASIVDLALNQGNRSKFEVSDTPAKSFFTGGPSLGETLGIEVDLETLPKYIDLGSLSTKPSALKERPEFPYWFVPQFNTFLARLISGGDLPKFGFKPPPYGKIHVLTESAGKLRIICPYNTPFVHSTGLFARCRSFLDRLPGDYSQNQAAGHRFVQGEMAKGATEMFISADLSNMTDDTSPEALSFGLRSLGLEQLDTYLFRLPIAMPNGKLIIPNKLLMGLKGCFELSTLIHHYVVLRGGVSRYAMVGDDLFFHGKLDTYLEAIKHTNWNVNRAKTVVSPTVAVFCGEMFWFGNRISPRVPKVSSCFHNGKPAGTSELFSITRCSIEHLNNIYSPRNVAAVMRPFIRLLRSRWKSFIIPTLPQKLRGLGFRSTEDGVGLIKLLSSRPVLYTAKLSIGVKKEKVEGTRWFGLPIQLVPDSVREVRSDFPALLEKGAVQLDVPKKRPALRKYVSALDDTDVLFWYYDNQRLEPNQFGYD